MVIEKGCWRYTGLVPRKRKRKRPLDLEGEDGPWFDSKPDFLVRDSTFLRHQAGPSWKDIGQANPTSLFLHSRIHFLFASDYSVWCAVYSLFSFAEWICSPTLLYIIKKTKTTYSSFNHGFKTWLALLVDSWSEN